jgi:transcriptional regulator with XRE-family HTH domain
MTDLYIGRTIDVKANCTRGDVYRDKSPVHHVYMAVTKRKRVRKPSKPTFEPCKLLAWRKSKDISQQALSDQIGEYLKEHGLQIGHSYSMIGRIERGLEPYNQVILQAAAHVLGTDVKSLLFIEPPAENEPAVEDITEIVQEVLKRRKA